MRRVEILATWFCLSSSAAWGALYNNDVPECAALGYDMSLSECQSQMQSLLSGDEYKKYNPLHCPYDYNKVKCWKNNCGGYTIAEPNANFESEECLLGIDGGKVQKMYRYTSCLGKDGVNYRYNNGDCIDRCNLNDYPYDIPPGSLYGKVESCYDDAMHYGYSACNEGFGKLVNGEYVPNNGRCDMLICDINEYPFEEKPDESRGTVLACIGGSNKFYRYDECNDGYISLAAKGGNCQKAFELESNKFNDVKVGDVLTYKHEPIGVFFATPEKDGNQKKYLVVSLNKTTWQKWGTNGRGVDNLSPITNYAVYILDFNGKANTLKLVNNTQDTHPAAEFCYNYAPSVCEDGSACGKHQWYLPSGGEMYYLFLNKNILNVSLPASCPIADTGQFWTSQHKSLDQSWEFRTLKGEAVGNNKYVARYVRQVMELEP